MIQKNNIGTWGGPHSWNNYHSVSSGKGRIIDLNIPSTIYGLPGVSFNVKSKAVRNNIIKMSKRSLLIVCFVFIVFLFTKFNTGRIFLG